jgi:hypothetical protein
MPSATYFVQECPTCGRRLQIRVEYLGKRVACQHCQGTFVAAETNLRGESADEGSALLRRANALLDSVAQRQLAGRPPVSR